VQQASSQEVEARTWTGAMSGPHESASKVSLRHGSGADSIPNAFLVASHAFPASGIESDSVHLSFTWNSGLPINCELTKEASAAVYAGSCTDVIGQKRKITMKLEAAVQLNTSDATGQEP